MSASNQVKASILGFLGGVALCSVTLYMTQPSIFIRNSVPKNLQDQSPLAKPPMNESDTSQDSRTDSTEPVQSETISLLQEQVAQKDAEIRKLTAQVENKNRKKDPYRPELDTPDVRNGLISEMLELSDAKMSMEQTMDIISTTFMKDLPDVDEKRMESLKELVNDVFAWEAIEPMIYEAYAEVFTSEQLYQINEFYRTEAGRILVEKSPELQQKMATLMQTFVMEAKPKLDAGIQEIMSDSNQEPSSNSEQPNVTH